MRLAWKDPVAQKWLNAVSGNSSGTPKFFARAYDPATDFHLGYFGVDTVNHVVWAVIHHNSQFGVSAIPDTIFMKLDSSTRLTSNTMHLQGVGVPNATTRLESSPDLNPNHFTTLT